MVGQPIEKRGRHLGVAENAVPCAEAEVRGEMMQMRRKSAQQVERSCPPAWANGR